jgi:hypothetical protein
MFVVACTGMIKPNYCQTIDLKEFKLIATSGNQPILLLPEMISIAQ